MENSWREWLESGIVQFKQFLEYSGPKLELYRVELFYKNDIECALLYCYQTRNEQGEFYPVIEEIRARQNSDIFEKVKDHKVDEPTIPLLYFLQKEKRDKKIMEIFDQYFQEQKFIKRELLWPVDAITIRV